MTSKKNNIKTVNTDPLKRLAAAVVFQAFYDLAYSHKSQIADAVGLEALYWLVFGADDYLEVLSLPAPLQLFCSAGEDFWSNRTRRIENVRAR